MADRKHGPDLVLSVESPPTRAAYIASMVGNSLRALWHEPRPADPPQRVWRDWVLLAVVLAGSGLEVALRTDRAGLAVAVAVSVVIGSALLWRRTQPLASVVVAFGTLIAFDAARIVVIEATGLHTIAAALVLAYALLRWGAGREAAIGLAVILVWLALTHLADPTSLDEVVAGYGFFLFAAALGASIRFHANTRLRDLEQARLRVRNELARELHDTVGHHVSAIAIQAQAGRAVAASHPDRALAVLETIEDAASRTLQELRAMVGVLRDGGAAQFAPQPTIADVERLAHDVAGSPRVEVHLTGDVGDLPPSVASAIHRIAQEAVTNALRHALGATHISVEVSGDTERVRLTVRDDGAAPATGAPAPGYGILGMIERASILGGEVRAGPDPAGGWSVEASLPRGRAATAPPAAAQAPS